MTLGYSLRALAAVRRSYLYLYIKNVLLSMSGMVQYLDHVEILGSNAISHDLYVSNAASPLTDVTDDACFQNGYVHNSFNNTSNNNCPFSMSKDVAMHGDEVQEVTNTVIKSGNHYLNQPVRCLSLCGHLQ